MQKIISKTKTRSTVNPDETLTVVRTRPVNKRDILEAAVWSTAAIAVGIAGALYVEKKILANESE